MLELAAVLVVVVLWVKRKSCLEPVSSDLNQHAAAIIVDLCPAQSLVNFDRYWSFSSSEHIFYPPKCVSVVHSKWEMLQEPPVKASRLIIFTADSSVLVKLSFQSQILILFDLMIKFSSSIWFDLISSLFLLLLLGFCMLFFSPLLPHDFQVFITLFLYPYLLLFPLALLVSFSTIRSKKKGDRSKIN